MLRVIKGNDVNCSLLLSGFEQIPVIQRQRLCQWNSYVDLFSILPLKSHYSIIWSVCPSCL